MTTNLISFVSTPSLQGLQQQLSHLSEFGANALVVEGDKGSGKTTLLQQYYLSQSAVEHREIALLLAKVSVVQDAPQFSALNALGSGFGIQTSGLSGGEIISRLRSFSEALLREKRLAVALIDDADELSSEELGALLSLLQQEGDATFGLKLIFFAEFGFVNRLDEMGLVDLAIYDFQLPPFSAKEVESLIQKVLPEYEPGGEANSKLPSFTALWSRSRGNPGKALQIAEAALSASESQNLKEDLLKMPVVHVVVVAVLLASLLLMFLYSSDDDIAPDRTTQEIVLNPESSISSGAAAENVNSPRVTAIDQSADGEKSAAKVREPSVDGTANFVNKTVGPEADTERASNPERGNDIALQDAGAVFEEGSEAEQVETESVPIKPVADESLTAVAVSEAKESPPTGRLAVDAALSDDEALLLDSASSGYVLQLLAASMKDALDEYLGRQANKVQMRVYRKRRNESSDWYVVVIGPFANKAAAQGAVTGLPAEQRDAKPWPKSMSAVQKEIREYHGL